MYFTYGLGIGLGIGSTIVPRIGVVICGASVGFFVGLTINIIIVNKIAGTNENFVSSLQLFFTSILFAVLSVPLYDFTVIITTSIFGSYMGFRVSDREK